ncbi:RlmE family RNA methyltransferase [Candidatus Pelagibacter sp. RS40]|uniref:RlmE family RNA methyltransferase n=1 Tax=Candidatus Pelagibacter sp. RS40 TaxID=1977865 RepID=UPI000A15FB1B|nr:RlmE family RNA methyltransferase [Candidatus Pelagibacter sp. RS40]ARJ48740.1 50S rRNA methyltransferase [Candidatus Pelagibacter sp. RS40]
MKKNKISKNWINKQKRDIYVRQSKLEGYRSRAVYKLQEIQTKFKVINNGMSIVDLGAAPGSWSEFISRKFKNIKLVAIDLKELDKIENVTHIKGDFTDKITQKKIEKNFDEKIDLVVSDMAVNTTGNKNVDSLVTGELSIEAMNFSLKILKKNGVFVSKIFMGSSFNEIVDSAKKNFKEFHVYKPPSSRKESKENFIICKNLR